MTTQEQTATVQAVAFGADASRSLDLLAATLPLGSRWRAMLDDLSGALAWSSDTLEQGEEALSPAPSGARPDRLDASPTMAVA